MISEREMTQTPEKTPNSILAERIAEKLYDSGLITKGKLVEIAQKLESGSIKEQDWRVYVEMATYVPTEKTDE